MVRRSPALYVVTVKLVALEAVPPGVVITIFPVLSLEIMRGLGMLVGCGLCR